MKNPKELTIFAKHVPEVGVEVCQEAAVKEPYLAYYFARDVKRVDI